GPDPVYRWRAGVWERVGTGELTGYCSRLCILDDGSGPFLYALGYLNTTLQWWAKRWTGSQWVDLSSSMFLLHQPWIQGDHYPFCTVIEPSGPSIFGLRAGSAN